MILFPPGAAEAVEAAQIVLSFIISVAIALALYFTAIRMIAAAPVPWVYVDEYNTLRLQGAAVVAARSNTPVNVLNAWLLNGTRWLPALACDANMSELLAAPRLRLECNGATYFYLYFNYTLPPGRYVLKIEIAAGNGLQNYTTSFVLS